MRLSRRETIKLLGLSAAATLVDGALLQRASGAAPPAPRMPLEEFVQSPRLLAALRKGVREMKRRKPSDPLSWFYQAAIHGVTDEAIEEAAKADPAVRRVFRKRYWNQCPHDGENSANFLPWHRGYTYYFEKILRMHTEESDFSLPYWNYTEKANRKFPKELGIEHLNGDINDNRPENINPLFLAERDFYFTSYEHPFAIGLPLLELTDTAVDISLPMAAPVFFGDTERQGLGGGIADEDPSTRGLLESYPHDHIHRAVGGIVAAPGGTVAIGAMATPPTAGFDPIFPIHHSNIDRLWALWACMPGKRWGKLPSSYWFNERPWFFFDTDGKAVNEPRKAYFNHRALGVRFKYEDPRCRPLMLPAMISDAAESLAERVKSVELLTEVDVSFAVPGAQRAAIAFPKSARERLRGPVTALKAQARADGSDKRLILRLQNVDLGAVPATGFDVHVTTTPGAELSRNGASFVGSIALFTHAQAAAGGEHHGGGHGSHSAAESFDISRAVAAADESLEGLSLVVVPYSLLTIPGKSTVLLDRDVLKVSGAEVFMIEQ